MEEIDVKFSKRKVQRRLKPVLNEFCIQDNEMNIFKAQQCLHEER